MKPITDRLAMVALSLVILVYGLISPANALLSIARSMKERGYYE